MEEDIILKQALAEQEAKLRDLNSQLITLRAIQEKRDRTHALVSQMRFNLGLPPFGIDEPEEIKIQVSDSIGLSDSTQSTSTPENPIWEAAQEVLIRAKQPLLLSQIIAELKGSGYKLTGRNGAETVRAALNRKSTIFVRVGRKKYGLKGI